MAIARIQQTFAEWEAISVEVEVTDSFPDCVAEAVAQAVRLWRDAVPDDADVPEAGD